MTKLFATALALGTALILFKGWVIAVVAGWFFPSLELSSYEGIGIALLYSIIHNSVASKEVKTIEDVVGIYLGMFIGVVVTFLLAASIHAVAT